MAYYNKKSKRWIARWQIDGKRKSKSGFTKKKYAEMYENQEKLKYEKGLVGIEEQTDITIKQLFDTYLSYLENNRATNTYISANSTLTIWKEFLHNNHCFEVRDLTSQHIANFIASFPQGKNSTINVRLNRLQGCIQYGIEKEIITIDPIKNWPKVALKKNRGEIPRYLTPEELEKIETAAKETSMFAYYAIYTLARTGLRISELCSLEANQIDFEKNYIYLPPEKTKSKYARFVPLSCGVGELLKKLIEQNGNNVFRSSRSKKITRNGIYSSFMNICRKVNITDINIHTLRKTFISNAIMVGEDPIRIMSIVGHQNWETIKKYLALSKHYIVSPVNLPFIGLAD